MRTLINILAAMSILLGLVSIVTPIPGGTILIAGGLTAMICVSPTAQFCLMWLRSRVSWINKLVFFLEHKVGTRIELVGTALGKTHPCQVGSTLSHREFIDAITRSD